MNNNNSQKQMSQSNIVPPRQQIIENNQSMEFHQKSVEHLKKIENLSKKDISDNSASKHSTTAVSVCCNIPTEAEIQKIIDEFNTLFRQYNEIISKNPKQDIQNTQSAAKFQETKLDQINVAVMTEQDNRELLTGYKTNPKIRKCKCTTVRRHSSSQSVRTEKSCICNFRRSKSDVCVRKAPSLKSINNSKHFLKSSRYSKQYVNAKPNWISKTMRKFKSKDERK